MSIEIILDEQWMVSVDNYHNHTPHRWKEVRKRAEGGGMKDTIPTGEYAWHTENKHFASVEQAIRLHIIPTMLLEGVDTASMEDYCKQAKELVDYFAEKLS